jgi:hypothetical protein
VSTVVCSGVLKVVCVLLSVPAHSIPHYYRDRDRQRLRLFSRGLRRLSFFVAKPQGATQLNCDDDTMVEKRSWSGHRRKDRF